MTYVDQTAWLKAAVWTGNLYADLTHPESSVELQIGAAGALKVVLYAANNGDVMHALELIQPAEKILTSHIERNSLEEAGGAAVTVFIMNEGELLQEFLSDYQAKPTPAEPKTIAEKLGRRSKK